MRSRYQPIGSASVLMLLLAVSGCTMMRHKVPAAGIRPTVLDAPRSRQEPINFLALRRDVPPAYLLGPRDVLGVYIEGILGAPEDAPPVHFPEDASEPPAIGYPIPVREDGTISMPLVGPLRVEGLTLAQTEEAIRRAYTVTRQVIQPGRDRIIVSLMRRRTYQVLVIREDVTTQRLAGGQRDLFLGSAKRGEIYTVDLPAYENDILHALSESGGLPGMDAKNEVTVLRGGYGPYANPDRILGALLAAGEQEGGARKPPIPIEIAEEFAKTGDPERASMLAAAARHGGNGTEAGGAAGHVWPVGHAQPAPLAPVPLLPPGDGRRPWNPSEHTMLELLPHASGVMRIPLRAAPGAPLPQLNPEDILLHQGDVLFVESRDAEVFYTGGVLPGGQFQIPRDYDLDVLGAISMAGGSIGVAGGGGTRGRFGGGSGMGGMIPPTQVTVVRMVDGYPMNIRTRLPRTLNDPQERILIQPNDIVMLDYTPLELAANILLSNLRFNYFLNNIN